MRLENNAVGPDGLIEATLYEISTGRIITPISVTRIEMLDLQDQGDQSYILGKWDENEYIIIDGTPVKRT